MASTDAERTFVLEQDGEQYLVEPLHNGESIEEFYSNRKYGHPHSHTTTDIERSDVSELFLWEEPTGEITLGMIHDDRYDGAGGDVTFEFSGFSDSAEWVVRDDDSGNDSYFGLSRAEWHWGRYHTDGGAIRPLEASAPENDLVTITPTFKNGIEEWQLLTGDAAEPERTTLDMSQPVTVRKSGSDTITSKVTTLSFIPGGDENSTRGGNALDSAIPHFFDEDAQISAQTNIGGFTIGGSVDLPVGPLFDNWHTGDMISELPTTLERTADTPSDVEVADERKADKYEEFPGDSFNKYRFKHQAEIEFEVNSDETVDESTVNVSQNTEGSYSIYEQEPVNNYPLEWADGRRRIQGPKKRPHRNFEIVTIDGVEGVRASTIAGSYIEYSDILIEKVRNDGVAEVFGELWGWPELGQDILSLVIDKAFGIDPAESIVQNLREVFATLPNIFSFIDVIALADGRELVRLWDLSLYPKHALYLGNQKVYSHKFHYGTRQNINGHFTGFLTEAILEAPTPYFGTQMLYEEWLKGDYAELHEDIQQGIDDIMEIIDLEGHTSFQYDVIQHEHPIAYRGRDGDGSPMNPDEVESLMDEVDEMLSPF